jgi:hypothetical protein
VTVTGEVAQTKFNRSVRKLPISTPSLQHGIVLSNADFDIVVGDLTPVFERLS